MNRTITFCLLACGFALATRTQAQNTSITNGWLSVGAAPGSNPQPGDAIIQRSLVVGATRFPASNGTIAAGDAYITGFAWLNRSLVFRDDASGQHRWIIDASNSDNKLRIAYGWDWSKGFECQPTGDVKFRQSVSIGNVECTTPSQCTGPLGINNLTLAVGGRIGARYGVHVLNPGVAWPDYVFASAYRLPPLREVEQFIAVNHHLPDIPPAAQVEAEGVELVSMQALLLKKLEEVTLHLIQLEKENEALKARVAKIEQ